LHLRSASGSDQYSFVNTASSYMSGSDKRAHFGLGNDDRAVLEIRWPSGIVQSLQGLAADQVLVVREAENGRVSEPKSRKTSPSGHK
jgi:hypothetical protein